MMMIDDCGENNYAMLNRTGLTRILCYRAKILSLHTEFINRYIHKSNVL